MGRVEGKGAAGAHCGMGATQFGGCQPTPVAQIIDILPPPHVQEMCLFFFPSLFLLFLLKDACIHFNPACPEGFIASIPFYC